MLVYTDDFFDNYFMIMQSKPKYWKTLSEKIKNNYNGKINDTTTLSALDHQLLRPDSNLGSINRSAEEAYVFRDGAFYREIVQNYSSALCKIVDEVLTNVTDHKMRLELAQNRDGITRLTMHFRRDKSFVISNDGQGMNIVRDTDGVWKIQKIFSEDHHSSNYDDTRVRYWPGRNGLGLKVVTACCEILDIATSSAGQTYHQVFRNNRSEISEPDIAPSGQSMGTRIAFLPDYEYFGDVDGTLFESMKPVFVKKLFDIAAIFPDLRVILRDENDIDRQIYVTPETYVAMHAGCKTTCAILHKNAGYRDNVFIIFPNVGRCETLRLTFVGGIMSKINSVHELTKTFEEGVVKEMYNRFYEKNGTVKYSAGGLGKLLSIIAFTFIQNPEFDSQTKRTLVNRAQSYKYIWPQITNDHFKLLFDNGLRTLVTTWLRSQRNENIKKAISETRVKLSDKYVAANRASAGNPNTILFVSEGDSAKAPLVAALPILGRNGQDNIGVYCFGGKIINASKKDTKSRNNAIIAELIQILGLEFDKKYTSLAPLRYKCLFSITDADDDGIHIFSLVVSLLSRFWPELLALNFLFKFRTPCVKALHNGTEMQFYSLTSYKKWKETIGDARVQTDYIKGLGSNDDTSFCAYLQNMNGNTIKIAYDEHALEAIRIAMGKDVTLRKDFLKAYNPSVVIDYDKTLITYSDHFNEYHPQYMNAANYRAIPVLMDGFKDSQRKIFWTVCSSPKVQKVNVFIGKVIQKANYHHGEQSLSKAIVSLAQNFVGARNINLLVPCGAFGSRADGPNVFSAPRYISTGLNDISRYIYRKEDECVLEPFMSDDNKPIHPKFYVGIIPMILVNGARGVGYAYSSTIPQFNPRDIVDYVVKKIEKMRGGADDGKPVRVLRPWYYGSSCEIVPDFAPDGTFLRRYLAIGKLFVANDGCALTITELPPGVWTNKYKNWLIETHKDKVLRVDKYESKVNGNPRITNVRIEVTLSTPFAPNVDLMRELGLIKKISLDNMYLFDSTMRLRKYADQYEIINDFCEIRAKYYKLRKERMLADYAREIAKCDSEYRYIYAIAVEKRFAILNAETEDLLQFLTTMSGLFRDDSPSGFDYLLNIKNKYLTIKFMNELRERNAKMQQQMESLRKTDIYDIWLSELCELSKHFGQ